MILSRCCDSCPHRHVIALAHTAVVPPTSLTWRQEKKLVAAHTGLQPAQSLHAKTCIAKLSPTMVAHKKRKRRVAGEQAGQSHTPEARYFHPNLALPTSFSILHARRHTPG